jgi:hypothetical protein
MLKRYTFWLTAGVLFEFLTAIIHSLSFIIGLQPENETERQMVALITTYRQDMGAGFHRTFYELFTALSACLPLLCLLSGFTLGYMLIKDADLELMRGVLFIHLTIFSAALVVMFAFGFIIPVLSIGIVVINLLLAYVMIPKRAA